MAGQKILAGGSHDSSLGARCDRRKPEETPRRALRAEVETDDCSNVNVPERLNQFITDHVVLGSCRILSTLSLKLRLKRWLIIHARMRSAKGYGACVRFFSLSPILHRLIAILWSSLAHEKCGYCFSHKILVKLGLKMRNYDYICGAVV